MPHHLRHLLQPLSCFAGGGFRLLEHLPLGGALGLLLRPLLDGGHSGCRCFLYCRRLLCSPPHIPLPHLCRRCLLPLPHLLRTVFVQDILSLKLSCGTEGQTGSVRRALLCLLRGILHRLTLVLGLPFLLLLGVMPLQDTHRRAGYGALLPRFRLLHGGAGLDVTHFAPPAWWSSDGTAPYRGAAH